MTCLFAFLMGRAWRAFISRSEHAAHTPYWRFELGYEICAEVMKTMPAKGIWALKKPMQYFCQVIEGPGLKKKQPLNRGQYL